MPTNRRCLHVVQQGKNSLRLMSLYRSKSNHMFKKNPGKLVSWVPRLAPSRKLRASESPRPLCEGARGCPDELGMRRDAAPTQPTASGLGPLPKLGDESTFSVRSLCGVPISSSSRNFPAGPVLTCDHLHSEAGGEGELLAGPGGRHGESLAGSHAASPMEGFAH